jgi:hypothetical protein
MINDIFGSVEKENFCYNCGHSLLMHAYYSLLEGHAVIEYEPLIIKSMWMGIPVILQIPTPIVKKGVCKCERFISKYDYEMELENDD